MPASDFIRDTAFGQIVRLITRNRWPQYPEEKNLESWKKFVDEKKSGNLARYGTTSPRDEESSGADQDYPHLGGVRTRDAAADSKEKEESGDGESDKSDSDFPTDGTYNVASGYKIDPDKGRDLHLVDWLENDPEVGSALPVQDYG